jgi:hypothetical protein
MSAAHLGTSSSWRLSDRAVDEAAKGSRENRQERESGREKAQECRWDREGKSQKV